MRLLNLATPLVLLASMAHAAVTELQIDITHKIPEDECTQVTKAGDLISMHYTGMFENGKVFDSSVQRSPLDFTLGAGQVIKGWDQGLLGMCIGEKRTLTIPPSLGYGSRGIGPIPGDSTLIFETELVAIKKSSKDEL